MGARLLRFNSRSRKAEEVDQETLKHEQSGKTLSRLIRAIRKANSIRTIVEPMVTKQQIHPLIIWDIREQYIRPKCKGMNPLAQLVKLILVSKQDQWENDPGGFKALVDEFDYQRIDRA